jgi:hypothetical protein
MDDHCAMLPFYVLDLFAFFYKYYSEALIYADFFIGARGGAVG